VREKTSLENLFGFGERGYFREGDYVVFNVDGHQEECGKVVSVSKSEINVVREDIGLKYETSEIRVPPLKKMIDGAGKGCVTLRKDSMQAPYE
jgi:hypothetical protein